MALHFIVSHSGEGTSFIASQFAAFAAALASGTVLLIDCTTSGGSAEVPRRSGGWAGVGVLEAYLEDGRIGRAITTDGPAESPHFAVLARRANASLHGKGNILADVLTRARERYSLVIHNTLSLEDRLRLCFFPALVTV